MLNSVLVFVLSISLSGYASYPDSFALKGSLIKNFQVSALVKASAGGVLQTIDEHGNLFRLTIPANSLAIDTVVRVTPVHISGVPGQLLHLGVDILPAGTKLLVPALLEIIPKNTLSGSTYWLETTGASENFHAKPAFPSVGGKSVELDHFSGGSMVIGNSETSAAMLAGGRPESNDWFIWQRNIAKQDLESGRIDKITFDKKMEIIENRIGNEVQKDIERMLEKSRAEAEAAIDRADRQAQEGDPAQWESFFDNLNTYLQDVRRSELLGVDGANIEKFTSVLSAYLEALYRNCANKPMGVKLAYKAERIRNLLGINQKPWDLEKCFGGNKIFHVRAEYILKHKNEPKPIFRHIDDVSKVLDIILTVQYAKPLPDIVVMITDFNDEKTKYDLKYEKDIYIGEGCPATQSPIGVFEVFDYNLKTEIIASYNPGFSLPPDVPVPPNFPQIKPSGSILLMNEGVKKKLGWNVVAQDPAHCRAHNEPTKTNKVDLNIGFDPVLLETIGTKKVESHVSEDSSKKEGWTYTIQRVN